MSPNSATEGDIDLRTDDDSNVSRRPILTYLGPAGTYSHQVYYTPKSTGYALKSPFYYRLHMIDLLKPCITILRIPSQVRAVTTLAKNENCLSVICQIDTAVKNRRVS